MSKKLSRAAIRAIAEAEANYYSMPSTTTTTTPPATTTTSNNDDDFDGETEYRAAILRRQRRIAIRARFLLDNAEEEEEDAEPVAAEPVTADPPAIDETVVIAESVTDTPVIAKPITDESICRENRPIAPARRRPARTTSGTKAGNVSVPAAQQKEAHVDFTGDLRASVVVVNHVASEPTSGSGSVPVVATAPIVPVGVAPVIVANADPIPAVAPSDIIDEDISMPLAGPIPVVPDIIVPDVATTTADNTCLSEDLMDIDGPEFSDHNDPMEVDMFKPSMAREMARLLDLVHRDGVSRGRSLPVLARCSSRVTSARSSARFEVRSASLGVRVGGGVRPVPLRTTVGRRGRMALKAARK